MILAALLLGFSEIVAVVTGCLLFRRILNAKQAEIEQRIETILRSWADPLEEGKPSKAAMLLDAAGSVIGAAAARSIMASLSAEQSHMAKAANNMSDELQGGQNPILGLLAGGKRGKGAAIAKLASILGPMLAGGAGSGGNHDGAHSSVADRIKRQA